MLLHVVPPQVSTVQPPLVAVDSFVQLICVVSGVDPSRNITWTFGERLVYFTTQTSGANITLSVSRSSYGVYTCTAANDYGLDASNVYILSSGIIDILIRFKFNNK